MCFFLNCFDGTHNFVLHQRFCGKGMSFSEESQDFSGQLPDFTMCFLGINISAKASEGCSAHRRWCQESHHLCSSKGDVVLRAWKLDFKISSPKGFLKWHQFCKIIQPMGSPLYVQYCPLHCKQVRAPTPSWI